jgi:hypothetical protein
MKGRKPKPAARQIAEGDPSKRGIRKLDGLEEGEPKAIRGLPGCRPARMKAMRRSYANTAMFNGCVNSHSSPQNELRLPRAPAGSHNPS